MAQSAKQTILDSLRASGAEKFPMPDLSALESKAMKFDNPLEAFCEAVKGAGGKVVFLSEQEDAAYKGGLPALQEGAATEESLSAQQAGTATEGGQSAQQEGAESKRGLPAQQKGTAPEGDLSAQQEGAAPEGGQSALQEGAAPQNFPSAVAEAAIKEVADEFRVKGSFGVAENGAVWIEALPEGATRRDLFIHETLIISLDKTQIVNNMHEAYRRLGEQADGYGLFISGPSKTADIEQALVFGAHGPKSLIIEL